MKDCIFCKIVAGEVPSVKIYEDDEFLVIQSTGQNVKGHSLIIPKEHSTDVLEMNSELGCKIFSLIQKIGTAMLTGLKADGFHTTINTKPIASHVEHTHIHMIPRYKGDGIIQWKEHPVSEEDRVIYAGKIIKEL